MGKEMKHKWSLLLVITLSGFFLDWLTKHLAETHLTFGSPVSVIGDYLQFLLVYNKGALFGLNPRSIIPSFPVNQFFFVFTILAVIMLILYYRSLPKTEKALHWGVMLILPGAFGNLLDRVIHPQKGVVDFIRVGISNELYWPIFNFADIYVTVGIFFLLYAFITEENRKKSSQTVVVAVTENQTMAAQESSVSNDAQ